MADPTPLPGRPIDAPPVSRRAAWVGSWKALQEASLNTVMAALQAHLPDAGVLQVEAWEQQLGILQTVAAQVHTAPAMRDAWVVLEYILPREFGRRPDVLVLMRGKALVLEFKSARRVLRSDVDQAYGYARDLRDYHTAFEAHETQAYLVLAGAAATRHLVDGVIVLSPDQLAATLLEVPVAEHAALLTPTALLEWEYGPLPTLVAAARSLFDDQPLPFIKRARSAGVGEAVARVLGEARAAKQEGGRRLLLVTGVPGAGKTLIGLQVAHSAALEEGYRFGTRKQRGAPATFLSGNGPLVQVLQHALGSTAFVQDMHAFIREYGIERRDKTPFERLLIFDEAQRAWDRAKIEDFYSRKLPSGSGIPIPKASEPDLLVQIAERMDEQAVILALVGSGQEIHKGEEAGMGQWAEALLQSPASAWQVVGPEPLAGLFRERGLDYQVEPHFDLNVSLRFHAADTLSSWVKAVLDEQNLAEARKNADSLRQHGYPIYLTRRLGLAKGYVRHRFGGEPLRRYGLLASSKAKLCLDFGLDPTFQATKRLRIGEWFNAAPEHPRSCCQLAEVVTEFQCQGLELDFAVVCWDRDLRWNRQTQQWGSPPTRPDRLLRDPHQLRLNAYRVLLTRGREGMILFVPPVPEMDDTYRALVAAGAVEASTEGEAPA